MNMLALCMHIRTTVHRRGRGLRGLVGVGLCACDMTNINYIRTRPPCLVGRCPSIMYIQWFGP